MDKRAFKVMVFIVSFFPIIVWSEECFKCHDKKIFDDVKNSVHSTIECVRCHPDAVSIDHTTKKGAEVDCGKCHFESAKTYFESTHGMAL